MKRGSEKPALPTQFAGPAESPGLSAVEDIERLAAATTDGAAALWAHPFPVRGAGDRDLVRGWRSPTQTRISQLSGIDPMTTSQVLRALETASLIERVDHPKDPRAKSIMVTRAGRDLARKAVVVVEATDAAFFKPLASDTARLVRMFQALVQGNERTEADQK